jgi:hypothetical protein
MSSVLAMIPKAISVVLLTSSPPLVFEKLSKLFLVYAGLFCLARNLQPVFIQSKRIGVGRRGKTARFIRKKVDHGYVKHRRKLLQNLDGWVVLLVAFNHAKV